MWSVVDLLRYWREVLVYSWVGEEEELGEVFRQIGEVERAREGK